MQLQIGLHLVIIIEHYGWIVDLKFILVKCSISFRKINKL